MPAPSSVTYLLATVYDYDDIRQFAMHRIVQAQLSDAAWREAHDFDLDAYIVGGAFGYLQGIAPITLIAHIAPPGGLATERDPALRITAANATAR